MNPKAIFLDRDGVLINNSTHYYIWKTDQLMLVDGILKNLRMLSQKGFQLFIVSNQGGISRGLYTKDDIRKLHAELLQTFRTNEVEIKDIAFCPHHPEIEKCLCRKPDSLMLEKLIAKYRINKVGSFFIGDSKSDMEAARKAGIKGIQTIPNQNIYPYISFLIK
jgi:D-glycero-D-manno-heptose 1,7-bisphosphate phosphatase